ncbi:MAG: hypothetical protein R3B82_19745 [Sandaracinaceae bacterium]
MRRLAPLLALGLASCVAVEGFDPVGDQAAIFGEWQIDGQDPSTELCDALGASRIRVTFLDDRRPVSHSGLVFQCRLGEFDTRAGSGAVVGAGRWTVRLDAIDDGGNVIAAGISTEAVVEQGTYDPDAGQPLIVVATNDAGTSPDTFVHHADFYSATLSTAFTLGGQSPTDTRCADAGIATVALVFDDLGGGAVTDTEPEACEYGLVGTRILPNHTYSVRLRAFDDAGATVLESSVRMVTPTTGQDYRLDSSAPVELAP